MNITDDFDLPRMIFAKKKWASKSGFPKLYNTNVVFVFAVLVSHAHYIAFINIFAVLIFETTVLLKNTIFERNVKPVLCTFATLELNE